MRCCCRSAPARGTVAHWAPQARPAEQRTRGQRRRRLHADKLQLLQLTALALRTHRAGKESLELTCWPSSYLDAGLLKLEAEESVNRVAVLPPVLAVLLVLKLGRRRAEDPPPKLGLPGDPESPLAFALLKRRMFSRRAALSSTASCFAIAAGLQCVLGCFCAWATVTPVTHSVVQLDLLDLSWIVRR